MRRSLVRTWPLVLGVLGLGGALVSDARTSAAGPQPAAASNPKLAVIVSVDGLSWDRLRLYRDWYVAGLKRLLEESQVESNARYRHLNTETAPGHASLSTGAPPRVTGIVGNGWYLQASDGSMKSLSSVDQAAPEGAPGSPPMFYRVVAKGDRLYVFASAQALEQWEASGETGRATVRLGYGPKGETVVFDSEDAITLFNMWNGRPKETFPPTRLVPGPGSLRVPTLGDRLAETRGGRLVSLSAKDRSAIFLAGRHARHAVYWYSQETGRFVTSPVYTPPAAAADLVSAFNRASAGGMLPARFGLTWKPLSLAEPSATVLLARPAPALSLYNYQIPTVGLGWDHTLAVHPGGYFTAVYYTPITDDLVTELALAFLADERFGLGRRSAPDILALSFSAQDIVSHSYGVDSEENLDVLRRLDLHLGRLLAALERTYPKGSVVLALSADHGFPPIPEAERARDPSWRGGRLLTSDRVYPNFVERLNRLLAEELCLEPSSRVIVGSDGFNLFYNRAAFPFVTTGGACGPEGNLVRGPDADRVLARVLRRHFGEEIESVYLVAERDKWPADAEATEYVRNDFDPERSGDAILLPRRGVMAWVDPARGAMHGSHYEYDTHVPLLFWGTAFPKSVSMTEATPYDLAPTLASVLGVELKDAVGRSRRRTP